MMPGESDRGPRPLLSLEKDRTLSHERSRKRAFVQQGTLRARMGCLFVGIGMAVKEGTFCCLLKEDSHMMWSCSSLCDQSMKS